MIIRDGQKWACRSCITGHRSSKCIHEDRELFPVAKKGRPSSQCKACNHGRATQSGLPADVLCTCQGKRRAKVGSKSPIETPPATASVAPPSSSNLGPIAENKRQRYSEDSAMYSSDGSPAFPAPGWPSSSSYGSVDSMQSMQSTSSCSSAASSPGSSFKSASTSGIYPYAPPNIPFSHHGTSFPNLPSEYQHLQAEVQQQYMRFHSLQAPQSDHHEHWYGGEAPHPPPLSPSAAGDSPSTALYKAMGLQGFPPSFSHPLSNPSPLLLEGGQSQDEYNRPPWMAYDMQRQVCSPEPYRDPYSQLYQHHAHQPQSSSFYNGMGSGNDIDPNQDKTRYTPSGARGPPLDSPGWDASTPSAVVKDSWMQLPMPDMQRPGYPDGPVRWNTAPPTVYSGGHGHGANEQHSLAYQDPHYQQEFPQPPPLNRSAASMPMPATNDSMNDSSRFSERIPLPQVLNLRIPEGKKRKSVDS